ncbi:IPT/TIG domain-containing protein [Paraburkholderia sp. MM5477-R1]|uniref:IPT/TIG domain-containing protein n=1 Tax=Paraburkholderia sp. MM5477-R1 TaxID=2991062 RepID=UPI003D1F7B30
MEVHLLFFKDAPRQAYRTGKKEKSEELIMMDRSPVVITSVSPLQGEEGTLVTLKGSGFAEHVRNNCVVIGRMGWVDAHLHLSPAQSMVFTSMPEQAAQA